MALMGANKPKNVIHIIINNGSHETVGGQPTVMSNVDVCKVAEGCGYPSCVSVASFEKLDEALNNAKNSEYLCLIEVKCAIGARENLGRPTTSAKSNKERFMEYLSE